MNVSLEFFHSLRREFSGRRCEPICKHCQLHLMFFEKLNVGLTFFIILFFIQSSNLFINIFDDHNNLISICSPLFLSYIYDWLNFLQVLLNFLFTYLNIKHWITATDFLSVSGIGSFAMFIRLFQHYHYVLTFLSYLLTSAYKFLRTGFCDKYWSIVLKISSICFSIDSYWLIPIYL